MTDEPENIDISILASQIRRRLAVLEQDVDGEKTVSRHMLRKMGDVENAVLDLTKAVAEITRGMSRLEDFVMTSQAEMPRKFAEIAAVVMREELAKQK